MALIALFVWVGRLFCFFVLVMGIRNFQSFRSMRVFVRLLVFALPIWDFRSNQNDLETRTKDIHMYNNETNRMKVFSFQSDIMVESSGWKHQTKTLCFVIQTCERFVNAGL